VEGERRRHEIERSFVSLEVLDRGPNIGNRWIMGPAPGFVEHPLHVLVTQ
jgi:hypothetical protein